MENGEGKNEILFATEQGIFALANIFLQLSDIYL